MFIPYFLIFFVCLALAVFAYALQVYGTKI